MSIVNYLNKSKFNTGLWNGRDTRQGVNLLASLRLRVLTFKGKHGEKND